jgi:DNA-binding MarR family transcriptional regulator
MQKGAEPRLRAWESFLRAHAELVPILARELDHAQRIPLNYYDVLVQLSGAPGHRLRLSQSALSRLVERMGTDGLVARDSDPADRRGTIVSLTRKGLAALRRAAPVHLASIERHFCRLISNEEARVLADVFERVRRAAQDER